MTYDLILKAFLSTYLISTIIFLICVYMDLGDRFERVVYVLLWPIFLILVGLNMVLATLNDGVVFILEAIWPSDGYPDEDEDSDEDEEDENNER